MQENGQPMAGRRCLVIAANPASREQYRQALATVTSDVDEADDGRDALAKAIVFRPAVVVSEQDLPFFNADVLCELLRHDPLTCHALILVIGDGIREHVQGARAAGANCVLIRPPAPDQLRKTVTALLANRIAPWIPKARASDRCRVMRCIGTTREPATTPPSLRCPQCDRPLSYVASYVGGAGPKRREQWDTYTCRSCNAGYEYRQRTNRVRTAPLEDVIGPSRNASSVRGGSETA